MSSKFFRNSSFSSNKNWSSHLRDHLSRIKSWLSQIINQLARQSPLPLRIIYRLSHLKYQLSLYHNLPPHHRALHSRFKNQPSCSNKLILQLQQTIYFPIHSPFILIHTLLIMQQPAFISVQTSKIFDNHLYISINTV